jgi:FAD/FMN-containing dehydrogenase/Fe-S oxidoreductase
MTTDIRIEPDVTLRQLQRPASLRRRTRSASPVDIPQLVAALRKLLDGDVFDDPGHLGLVAQDASNYFYVPLALVLPRHREDTLRAVEVCRRFGAPITCRAGATALAGQTCNEAVIFDFSRYMTRVLSVDLDARRARVEPGVICDDLVSKIKPHGLTFGPKPATHDHCCFGGMIANNCGGMEAQLAGTAVDNVESLEVVLYDGTVLQLGWMSDDEFRAAGERPGREGELYRALYALRERTQDQVRARYPKIPRRISGYNLDRLIPDASGRVNVARALVGTEGTCAITLSAEVVLTPLPPHQTVVGIGFRDVFEAADAVPKVLEFKPMICEGLDRRLIEHVRNKHMREARYLSLLPEGHGWLVVRLGADTKEGVEAKAEALCAVLKAQHKALDSRAYDDPEHERGIWKVRESGLGATAFVPGDPDTWPGWEDTAVPPERLGAYLRDARDLFAKYGYHPALYGHFGDGLLHCRVDFDVKTARGIENWKAFLREAAALVSQKYGGSLSGEHGDGQARGWLLEIMFGPDLVQAFREFKAIWDPDHRMNPGRIVDADPVDANLRLGADYDPAQPATHFHYPDDNGSFARAAMRCVGVGKCRRTAAEGEAPEDVMCPSYMVTHDEQHCTRGRAHLLWEMMRGNDSPIRGGFRDEHVKESLDLCLACKGCKSDCPVNVDMATYKAEFLSHYWAGRLRPRYAYAFGWIDKWARLAAIAPGLVNLVTHAKPTAWLAKWVAGMTGEHEVPRFAPETFVSWFQRRGPSPAARQRVVLWADTFNNHFHTHTAQAAVDVLEASGFEVIVPSRPMCCGRPLYDYGFLDMARSYLENVLDGLEPYLSQSLPIVVLEPSCASVFRDELPNLMPGRIAAQRLQKQTKLLSELLIEHDVPLPEAHGHAIVQGHCHHKSVLGYDAQREVFRRMKLDAKLLSSGCCGMAGSFGFEREEQKQEVSKACGERVLFPAVRELDRDALIIADGFSCQTQIESGTERQGVHLAEVVKLAREGRQQPSFEARQRSLRAPERLALVGLVLIAAGTWLGTRALSA